MSPSKMRKTVAYRDGVCHADGGEDRRHIYTSQSIEAYDLGFNEHNEYLANQKAAAEHPLRLMRKKVEDGMDRQRQNLPIAAIVLDVIEDMLIYLEEKESI